MVVRLLPDSRQGQFSGLGASVFNPSVFYSVRAGKWFASFIASGCGGQGLGQWESANGLTWISSGCIFSVTPLDRHSTWVDNNPGSPFYGRQYATFTNFSIAPGVPQLTYSTDDGVTWSTPITLSATFRRALKVTGSLGTDGTIFVQTMEEGGGGLNGPRMNHIYRSTNGGVSFTAIQQNEATFLTPGRSAESSPGYFVGM